MRSGSFAEPWRIASVDLKSESFASLAQARKLALGWLGHPSAEKRTRIDRSGVD
jgi:hypothetical protein